MFSVKVLTGDRKSYKQVRFKFDPGADFTTLSSGDLRKLGYEVSFLETCAFVGEAVTAGGIVPLYVIENVSIGFEGNRRLQKCKLFFTVDKSDKELGGSAKDLRSLFGNDILQYFNYSVSFDKGEIRLVERTSKPVLADGETPIEIFSLDSADALE
jgi:hypothetical protein